MHRFSYFSKYSIFGVLFGCCFPIFALIFDGIYLKGLRFSVDFLGQAHSANPLHYIIDTAPFFLGIAFGLAGRLMDRIKKFNANLQQEVHLKTQDIATANEELNQNLEEMKSIQENLEKKQHELEVALAQNQAVNEALEKSAIVSIADLSGRILKVNEIFSQISGYSEEELIGQDHKLLNSGHHPKIFWKQMWQQIARGHTWRAEVCNKAKDGSLYWVDSVINPIRDKDGKIYQYLSIRYLITHRKLQEQVINENLEQLISLQQKSESSKKEIERLLEKITASINYAKRIQVAIMPSESHLESVFSDSFIIFKPKDIVSGDFYWVADKGDKKIAAVGDCTGHGVSGAFMTMIANNILNEIVHSYEIHEADDILNIVPILLEKVLKNSEQKIQDGMDIAVITVLKDKIIYAGAMNPLYYVRDEDINEIKADKKPIGGGYKQKDDKDYTRHEISLDASKPTMFYLFSDGFQDQFGGKDNKKFMGKNLRQLFISVAPKTIDEQKYLIEKCFEDWRGTLPQTDDVLVFGVRL